MTHAERRTHRRLPLHLAVSPTAQGTPRERSWVTGNVSSGGMYVRVPADQAPGLGSRLEFVLAVPPGEGHSPRPSHVRGSGQVARVEDLGGGQAGVAVQFTAPLTVRPLWE